jgi:hypothetical protein
MRHVRWHWKRNWCRHIKYRCGIRRKWHLTCKYWKSIVYNIIMCSISNVICGSWPISKLLKSCWISLSWDTLLTWIFRIYIRLSSLLVVIIYIMYVKIHILCLWSLKALLAYWNLLSTLVCISRLSILSWSLLSCIIHSNWRADKYICIISFIVQLGSLAFINVLLISIRSLRNSFSLRLSDYSINPSLWLLIILVSFILLLKLCLFL